MNRIVHAAPFAALLLASTASAAPGAVYIDHATVSIALSVHNVSGSDDVQDRIFGLVSDPPIVHVDGDFGCPQGTSADSIELAFGQMWMVNSTPTWFVLWDSSEPVDLQGAGWGGFSIDHALDLPESWHPGVDLINFGFNPSKVVSDHYDQAEAVNADMVHWMQSDQVFQSSFTMNAVLWCEGPNGTVGGLDSVEVDVDILYTGDHGIDYQPVAGGPTDVTPGGSGTPGYDAGAGGSGTGGSGTGGSSTAGTVTTGTSTGGTKPGKRGR